MEIFDINNHISGELVKEIKKGNTDSFKLLFTSLWNPLLNFTCRIVKDVQVAENILQDLFLYVWEHRELLDEEENLKSYLYTAAKNRSLNFLKRPDTYFEDIEESENLVMVEQESNIINEEIGISIEKSINRLPEKCGIIFRMNRYDNLTYKEIARILNISEKTVETQMSRALKKLRTMLAHLIKIIIFIKTFFAL